MGGQHFFRRTAIRRGSVDKRFQYAAVALTVEL
jgi:hypothetical protein